MTGPPRSPHYAILGGGLTGLATAHLLARRLPSSPFPAKITLFESSDRLGGWINSERHAITYLDQQGERIEGEVTLEGGPRSIRPRGSKGAAGMLAMIHDLGLQSSLITIPKSHPSAKNRFILSPSSSPSSPPTLTPLRLNPFNHLLRPIIPSLLAEPFRRFQSPPAEYAGLDDESVDSFLTRRFGPHLATLASAGMHGIYAASSTQLSARAVMGGVLDAQKRYGSVILGLLRRGRESGLEREREAEQRRWEALGEVGKGREDWAMYGLKGGLSTLVEGLRADLERRPEVEIRMREDVKSVAPTSDGVEISTSTSTHTATHLIATLPPPFLAPLLPPSAPLPNLSANPYTTVGVVSLVFALPPSHIHPAGFGYLIPRPDPSSPVRSVDASPHGVLGVIFDSTALPGLDSPNVEGRITKLTVMMGGPYWSTYPSPSSPRVDEPVTRPASADALLAPALEHLKTVLPSLRGVEPILAIPRLHTDCIPTYLPGHYQRVAALHHAILDGPWAGKLSLAGNGYGGVGVNDCVWSAQGVVNGLAKGRGVTGLESGTAEQP